MRLSGKEITVREYVKRTFVFQTTECSACGHFVNLERMYVVPQLGDGKIRAFIPKLGRWVSNPHTAAFCNQCAKSKEDAFDMAFKYEITAEDIIRTNQVKLLQKQFDDAFNAHQQSKEATMTIVREILALPDGEVIPSVHSVLVKHIT